MISRSQFLYERDFCLEEEFHVCLTSQHRLTEEWASWRDSKLKWNKASPGFVLVMSYCRASVPQQGCWLTLKVSLTDKDDCLKKRMQEFPSGILNRSLWTQHDLQSCVLRIFQLVHQSISHRKKTLNYWFSLNLLKKCYTSHSFVWVLRYFSYSFGAIDDLYTLFVPFFLSSSFTSQTATKSEER